MISLTYRNKGGFFQRLHTGVLATYVGVLFLTAILFDHPVCLGTVFAIELVAVSSAGFWNEWKSIMPASLWMAGFTTALNFLLSQAGETVLFGIGQLTFTIESLCYGATMGLRLMTMFTACWLGTVAVNPDRLLSLASGIARKLALMAALATRTVPCTWERLQQVHEALEARGVNFHDGGILEKLRKRTWLLDVLVFSALEGSFELAEAIHARGFGCGPRSHYVREILRPADLVCLGATIMGLALAVLARLRGAGTYVYYPRMAPMGSGWSPLLVGMAGAYLVPAALTWGCRRWPFSCCEM